MATVTGVTRDGVRDYFRVNRRPQQITGLTAGADNTSVINNAISAANPYDTLVIPEGDWTHSSTIQHNKMGVVLEGYGARLLGTVPRYGGLRVSAANAQVRGLIHEVVGATARGAGENLDDCPFSIDTADGVVLEDIVSIGSRDAQFFINAATNARIKNIMGRNSFADGLHISYGSKNVTVDGVEIVNPGDDGVAVVSYVNDFRPCSNIRISRIGVVNGQARGVSIVGGSNIHYAGVRVTRCRGAGVYIAHEQGDFNTSPVSRASVVNGDLVDANWDSGLDSGAVGFFNLVSGTVMTDVLVAGMNIHEMRKGTGAGSYILAKTSGGNGGRYKNCALQDINILGGTSRGALYADGVTNATTTVGAYTYQSASGTGVTTNSEGYTVSGSGNQLSDSSTTTAAPGLIVTRVRMGALYATA